MEGLLEFRVLGDAKWTPRWVSLQSGMLKVSQVSNSAENIKAKSYRIVKAIMADKIGDSSVFRMSTLSGKTIEGKCNGNEDAALWVNVFEGAKPRRGSVMVRFSTSGQSGRRSSTPMRQAKIQRKRVCVHITPEKKDLKENQHWIEESISTAEVKRTFVRRRANTVPAKTNPNHLKEDEKTAISPKAISLSFEAKSPRSPSDSRNSEVPTPASAESRMAIMASPPPGKPLGFRMRELKTSPRNLPEPPKGDDSASALSICARRRKNEIPSGHVRSHAMLSSASIASSDSNRLTPGCSELDCHGSAIATGGSIGSISPKEADEHPELDPKPTPESTLAKKNDEKLAETVKRFADISSRESTLFTPSQSLKELLHSQHGWSLEEVRVRAKKNEHKGKKIKNKNISVEDLGWSLENPSPHARKLPKKKDKKKKSRMERFRPAPIHSDGVRGTRASRGRPRYRDQDFSRPKSAHSDAAALKLNPLTLFASRAYALVSRVRRSQSNSPDSRNHQHVRSHPFKWGECDWRYEAKDVKLSSEDQDTSSEPPASIEFPSQGTIVRRSSMSDVKNKRASFGNGKRHNRSLSLSEAIIKEIPLRMCLENPLSRQEFVLFLERIYATESLNFLDTITAYKEITGFKERKAAALNVIGEFLVEDAPQQVNVSDRLLSELVVEATKGNFQCDLFKNIEEEVFNLLEKDSYLKFKEHKRDKEEKELLSLGEKASVSNGTNEGDVSSHHKMLLMRKALRSRLTNMSYAVIPLQDDIKFLQEIKKGFYTHEAVKTRWKRLQRWQCCFRGKDLVGWLLETRRCSSREEAVVIGQRMTDSGFVQRVSRPKGSALVEFIDTEKLYYFTGNAGRNGVVKVLQRGRCVSGFVLMKGQVKYNKFFMIINIERRRLHCYHGQMDSAELFNVNLNNALAICSESRSTQAKQASDSMKKLQKMFLGLTRANNKRRFSGPLGSRMNDSASVHSTAVKEAKDSVTAGQMKEGKEVLGVTTGPDGKLSPQETQQRPSLSQLIEEFNESEKDTRDRMTKGQQESSTSYLDSQNSKSASTSSIESAVSSSNRDSDMKNFRRTDPKLRSTMDAKLSAGGRSKSRKGTQDFMRHTPNASSHSLRGAISQSSHTIRGLPPRAPGPPTGLKHVPSESKSQRPSIHAKTSSGDALRISYMTLKTMQRELVFRFDSTIRRTKWVNALRDSCVDIRGESKAELFVSRTDSSK
ncbi:hypothetical protein AAMO2058_000252500 [Amorphochlora amoebiformis]